MPASNACWGIEVGAGAIKALKLEATDEGARVIDLAIVPHKRVLSDPEIDQADALRVGLGTLTSQFNVAGEPAVMSVPGHSAFARFAKLPPVEPKKVPDIVKFEAVQQIPFSIELVEWDYRTFQSPDSPDVEVGIFAITRERMMQNLALWQDVGLVPDAVTLSPVAAYNALAHDLRFTVETPGTVILDVGTTSTDLLVAEAGRVWIRTFPIGGHHFTQALMDAFKLTYSKAERLKREAQESKHARHIFQVMRPVFSDLAQDVQRSIGYYQSLHRDAKLARLICLGSTFHLPGLRKYLSQQVQMNAYRVDQFKRLSINGPRDAELQASAMNLCTAYGLALQGLGLGTLDVNLMPATVLRQAMWQRKVKWFGVAAGLAVGTAGALFIRPFLDVQAVAGAPAPVTIQTTAEAAKALQRRAEAAGVTKGGMGDLAAANALALLDSRDIYARLVDDLGQMLEDANVRLERDGMSGPAFVVRSMSTKYQVHGLDPNLPPSMRPRTGPGSELKPRVTVELELTTTHPDPRRFHIDTIDAWLREHADRPELPYVILPRDRGATVVSKELEISPAGQLAAVPALTDPGRAPGAGTSPRGRRLRGTEEDAAAVAAIPQPENVTIVGMPEGGAVAAGRAASSRTAGAAELNRLAPIPPLPPEGPPGTRVSTLRVTWVLELRPPA